MVNESDQRFQGVRLQVILYDLYEQIVDTQTLAIGSVAPWGRRAFSAKLRVELPANERISRFDCKLIYQGGYE